MVGGQRKDFLSPGQGLRGVGDTVLKNTRILLDISGRILFLNHFF